MISSQTPFRYLIFFSIFVLSACQIPVRPDTPKVPAAPTDTNATAVTTQDETPTPLNPEAPAVNANGNEVPATNELPNVASNEKLQTGAAVFSRLKASFSGPICNDSLAIKQWEKRYGGNAKSFSSHLGDILPLLDYVSLEVERRNLPGEFALIPIVETWYRPNVVGAGGPSGLWQMIASTARNHGIIIQSSYDGRFSVIDSTDAALSYLGSLQKMFSDWQRTMMAYNAGEYRVLRAIKASGNEGAGQDHWPKGLSSITYAYIAKIQALSCLIAQPEQAGLTLPNATEFMPLAAVTVAENIKSLETLAKRNQLDISTLKQNNPAYKHDIIPTHSSRRVLLPAYLAQPADLVEVQDSSNTMDAPEMPPVATELDAQPDTCQVRRGDTLSRIGKRYGITVEALRRLNGLGKHDVLQPGQTLKLTP